MRASVTVSIAAETIGISSAIVRVRRLAVTTSFGRTADSAGTSRTSSKVRPSFANLSCGSPKYGDRNRCPGRRPAYLRGVLQLVHLDHGCEAPGLGGIEAARAHLQHGSRARRSGEAKRLLAALAVEDGHEPLGEERVAGADDRYGLEPGRDGAVAANLTLLAHEREAAVLERDVDVARAELRDRVERHQEVLVVEELLADELLGLVLVGRDEPRLGLEPETKRLALRVEDDPHAMPGELPGSVGVERLGDSPGQRAGEDHELGPTREVAQLVQQDLQLALADLRPPLVDLGLCPGRRIHDERRRSRLARDADEVVQDRLGGELLDDARAGTPSSEAGGDDRHVEALQRAGDVDALPTGERQDVARAMPLTELEDRHRHGSVERRVERDGDDHDTSPRRRSTARPATQRAFCDRVGSGWSRAATSGERATTRAPSVTTTEPSR